MREDGRNAGHRGIGRLAMALMLWALGIGASAWLGFYIGFHDFRKKLSQEQRAAVYTGALERPKSPIAIKILRRGCIDIFKVDIDGGNLLIYTRNHCHAPVSYVEWHAALLAPNGTIIKETSTNWKCAIPREPGSSAECELQMDIDDRTAVVQVWIGQ